MHPLRTARDRPRPPHRPTPQPHHRPHLGRPIQPSTASSTHAKNPAHHRAKDPRSRHPPTLPSPLVGPHPTPLPRRRDRPRLPRRSPFTGTSPKNCPPRATSVGNPRDRYRPHKSIRSRRGAPPKNRSSDRPEYATAHHPTPRPALSPANPPPSANPRLAKHHPQLSPPTKPHAPFKMGSPQ